MSRLHVATAPDHFLARVERRVCTASAAAAAALLGARPFGFGCAAPSSATAALLLPLPLAKHPHVRFTTDLHAHTRALHIVLPCKALEPTCAAAQC